MDPLSAAASIIAVLQLSTEVIKYVNAAAGARSDKKRLRCQIREYEKVPILLKDESDDPDSSEEGQEWSEKIKALEAPGAPLGRLWITLKLLESKLQPKNGLKAAAAKLTWPFEEKEIGKIFDILEREQSLLNMALEKEHRKLSQAIQKSVRENGKQLVELIETVRQTSNDQEFYHADLRAGLESLRAQQEDHEADRQRHVILDWFTPIDYASQQSDFIHRRQPGTVQWLLDSSEFNEWVESDGKSLIYPGNPGAGKTILTTTVIDHTSTSTFGAKMSKNPWT